MILVIIWYVYLSAIDWAIHKHILHSDSETEIRIAHRMHHMMHNGDISETGIGLTFSPSDGLFISVVTVLPVLGVARLLGRNLLYALLIHFSAVFFGIGMHNYAHSRCHSRANDANWFNIPVPTFICELLERHHLRHHQNPKTNFCTAYLGFDNLVGTTR
jgi:hypothetical protein